MAGNEEGALILVVEDELDIRLMITKMLKDAGFRVVSAENGEKGVAMAREHRPLVVTLDRMLPGIDGLEVCRQIRDDSEISDTYIIMVTALGNTDDRIDGLEVGADDYISKPFSKRELVLRVKAAVRRLSMIQESSEPNEMLYGILKIDDGKHRIWVDNEEVNMTITEYKLLLHLVNGIDRLCSRGELLQDVWELPPTLNTRTVDTHIKRLRQKLGKASNYIQTVRGAGYRFSTVD